MAAETKRSMNKASIDIDSNDEDNDWHITFNKPDKKKKPAEKNCLIVEEKKPAGMEGVKPVAPIQHPLTEGVKPVAPVQSPNEVKSWSRTRQKCEMCFKMPAATKRLVKKASIHHESNDDSDDNFFTTKRPAKKIMPAAEKPAGKLDKCMNRLYQNQSNKI